MLFMLNPINEISCLPQLKAPSVWPLRLPLAIICACHIIQKTRSEEGRGPDPVTEYMTKRDNLVLVHVEAVVRVVVALE
jgi:hypothetical protein